uniref:(northern house mosquito) hypothetical protein n=1 Tax=Culex pipiens TaxID=7175 RepID=A0A8D8C368_CULPI
MDSVQTLEALEIDVGDFTMEEQYLEEDPFADCPAGDGDTDGPSVSANPYQLNDSEFDNSAAPEQPDESEFANSAASDQFDESAGGGGPSKKRKNKTKGKHDTSEDLFMCTLAVYKREFKGQTSGQHCTLGGFRELERGLCNASLGPILCLFEPRDCFRDES